MPIQYKQYGDNNAPLMLFLHGGGVSGWMWDKQTSHFQQKYHCVVPDLPGHGTSHEISDFTIKQTAVELNNLIERLASNKVVIAIGFSLGAQILVQMLNDKPDLIHYAMINSALVKPMPLAASIAPLMKLTFPLVKLRAFAKLQARTLYIGEDCFERYYQDSLLMKREVLIQVLQQNMSFSIPEHFAKANANILITVGQHEKGMMKTSAESLKQCNDNSRLLIFNGVGHGLSLQNPKRFNDTIEGWLS